MEHDGKQRHYRIHVPDTAGADPRPLVVVLHGGGGNAEVASKMGFTALAERENFIVVYPEATAGHWNDGRVGRVIVNSAGDNDDVGFIMALIEKIKNAHVIDPQRIYATGFSNGGIMSHRLGIERADIFAAIAPCIGGIAKPLGAERKFKPSEPLSVLIIQGTEDPFVPYGGGRLTVNLLPALGKRTERDHGAIVSTDQAIKLWNKANGILGEPRVNMMADTDRFDGCSLERSDWPPGDQGSQVSLIRMVDAGHTVPGARQYLPKQIIGKTCRDANASEIIWSFFKAHPKLGEKQK
jgi:polyhydroxybutyrate depolymerase